MHIVGAQAMPVASPSLVCMGKLFVCVSDAFQKPTLCILVLFGLLPELSHRLLEAFGPVPWTDLSQD